MQHLGETTVLQLLRGGLSAPERTQVEVHIDRCPECRELISALASQTQPTSSSEAPPSSHSPPGPAWQRGTLLGNRFEIEERCGQGAMGTIFRGRDRQTGAVVAIKALFLTNDQADFARFEREADILSSLAHPAIVRYVAHGTTSHGDAYLVMEWLAGEDLAARLARGPMPVAEVLRLTKRLAQGLWIAHARGIVHRDVKPSNVMLPGGNVDEAKLVDFGIARAATGVASRTQKGMLLGTPSYMAPEQARGRPLDARADVFALGCVVYECLTGLRAFHGEDVLEVLARVLLDAPVPPGRIAAGVPPALDGLVLSMLEKDPTRRVPTCREIIAALGPLLGEPFVPSAPPPAGFFPSAPPDAARSTAPAAPPRATPVALVAGVAAVLGVLVIGLSVALWRTRAASEGPRSAGDVAPKAAPAGDALQISSLASISLAQTPESMATATGQPPHRGVTGEIEMTVPLRGGAFTRMELSWDPADPTHVREVDLYGDAPPPHDAAIRKKLSNLFGRRLDKDGDMSWGGARFSYDGEHGHLDADRTIVAAPNPHWKAQVDAMWNVLRGAVLELPVEISEADERAWLGRGYPLATVASIDVATDTDHADAMLRKLFPGVAARVVIDVEHVVAIDHPWYGAATLAWKNAKGGALQELLLRPPPDTDGNFRDQEAIETCAQALIGGTPRRNPENRADPNHDSEWRPSGGGSLRVYRHMVVVAVVSPFVQRKMDAPEFARIVRGLDACGRKR